MLPTNRTELLESVRWAAGGPPSVEVSAPDTVTMSLFTQMSGRRLLHLVNYDEDHPVGNIGVVLRLPPERRAMSVNLLVPESNTSQTLPMEQRDGQLRFTVPHLTVYGLVLIE
jgi:hypothetical protein